MAGTIHNHPWGCQRQIDEERKVLTEVTAVRYRKARKKGKKLILGRVWNDAEVQFRVAANLGEGGPVMAGRNLVGDVTGSSTQ
jgi:hypothetical protein